MILSLMKKVATAKRDIIIVARDFTKLSYHSSRNYMLTHGKSLTLCQAVSLRNLVYGLSCTLQIDTSGKYSRPSPSRINIALKP